MLSASSRNKVVSRVLTSRYTILFPGSSLLMLLVAEASEKFDFESSFFKLCFVQIEAASFKLRTLSRIDVRTDCCKLCRDLIVLAAEFGSEGDVSFQASKEYPRLVILYKF